MGSVMSWALIILCFILVIVGIIYSNKKAKEQERREREERERRRQELEKNEPVNRMIVALEKAIDGKISDFDKTVQDMKQGKTTKDCDGVSVYFTIFDTLAGTYNESFEVVDPAYSFIEQDNTKLTKEDVEFVTEITKARLIEYYRKKYGNVSVSFDNNNEFKPRYLTRMCLTYNNPKNYKVGL